MPLLSAASRPRLLLAMVAGLAAAELTTAVAQTPAAAAPDSVLALVGGTVIDGTGGPPLPDATVVVAGDRIAALGPSATTAVPDGAWRIDVRGKYLTPGFIDGNLIGLEGKRQREYVREFLRHGVTTARATHGSHTRLLPLRDSLRAGQLIGLRLLVAGNIIGLGNRREPGDITQQMAYALRTNADSLRILTGQYLDYGLDFIKIAVTDHNAPNPQPVIFSRPALEAMVDEAHRRGKLVDSHTNTAEGLRLAALAGIDVAQHPEKTRGAGFNWPGTPIIPQVVPADVARLLAARGVICVVYPADLQDDDSGRQGKANILLLARHGCRIAIGTDVNQDPQETLRAIEALVEFGMTPAEALTAATRHGALAAGAGDEYGTLEIGKQADVVVLAANPLVDIHNIERLELVVHQGYVIDSSGTKLCRAGAGC